MLLNILVLGWIVLMLGEIAIFLAIIHQIAAKLRAGKRVEKVWIVLTGEYFLAILYHLFGLR